MSRPLLYLRIKALRRKIQHVTRRMPVIQFYFRKQKGNQIMKMIKAVVRPSKSEEVLDALLEAGFRAVTKYNVLGRGKQRGLKVDNVYYDEIPKDMLMLVVEDDDAQKVVDVIVKASKTQGEGTFGDGKIFILPVEDVVTVSSGKKEL